MAGNLSDYAANATLNALLAGTVYVALHTGAPGTSGAANEIGAGVGYARQAATFPGAGRSRSNAANITFGPASGAGFGTASHVSIWDAAIGGNCIWQGALGASQLIPAGIPGTIAAGTLTVSF